MSNDPHERFFKLLAKVMMMVLDGKRDIFYVYGVLSGERATASYSEKKSWYQRINERLALVLLEPNTYLGETTERLQEIVDGPKPVFVEFTVRIPSREEMVASTGRTGDLVHFVGTTLEDILQQTNQGNHQGLFHFSSHRVVPQASVEKMNLQYTGEAILDVKKGCWCFQLGPLQK